MYVYNPKTRHKIFLDNAKVMYEDRLEEVKAKVLSNNDIVDYCSENAYIKNNSQEFSYKNTERILENCATYLLRGQYKENNIMTLGKIRKVKDNEMPLSSVDGNAEDVVYSNGNELADRQIVASTEIMYSEDNRSDLSLSGSELKLRSKSNHSKISKFRSTKNYRLECLHSTKSVRTYKLRRQFAIDTDGNKVPLRDVVGHPIFDAEYETIGGRKGVIDERNIYHVKWCIVDTDNVFKYNDSNYRIDYSYEPYQSDSNKTYSMDRIMVVPTDDKLIFYNQDIDKIPDDVVKKCS